MRCFGCKFLSYRSCAETREVVETVLRDLCAAMHREPNRRETARARWICNALNSSACINVLPSVHLLDGVVDTESIYVQRMGGLATFGRFRHLFLHGRPHEFIDALQREILARDPAPAFSAMPILGFYAQWPSKPRSLSDYRSTASEMLSELHLSLSDSEFFHRLIHDIPFSAVPMMPPDAGFSRAVEISDSRDRILFACLVAASRSFYISSSISSISSIPSISSSILKPVKKRKHIASASALVSDDVSDDVSEKVSEKVSETVSSESDLKSVQSKELVEYKRAKMRIIAIDRKGKQYLLLMEPWNMVYTIRENLACSTGMSPNNIILTFGKVQLENSTTIKECDMCDGSILRIIYRDEKRLRIQQPL